MRNDIYDQGGGAKREDKSQKIDYTLIPPEMLKRLAIRYTEGGQAHGMFNWLKGDKNYMDLCKQSAMRHFMSRLTGETDEDHMSACVWNLFAYETLKDKLNGKLDGYLKEKLQNMIDEDLQPYK